MKQRGTICYGYQTAVEILRALSYADGQLRSFQSKNVPMSFPSIQEVRENADRLQYEHPSLSLSEPFHVMGSSPTRNCRSRFMVSHRCSYPLNGRTLLDLGYGAMAASAPFAFVQMATVLPLIDLLELGYEFCGTYRRFSSEQGIRYDAPPLTSVERLRRFIDDNPSLHGVGLARRALSHLADGAASPREAKCALLFGLPATKGGYGMGMPTMNHELRCTPEARALASTKTVRCDLYWPTARLDLEYQSHAFHEGERARVRDSRRANALRAMGVNVVFVTDNELDSMEACDVIAATGRRALGKRGSCRVDRIRDKRLRLRRQLGLPLEPRRTFAAGAVLGYARDEGRA